MQHLLLGMHDIGFFADIQYSDILQLIWPIIFLLLIFLLLIYFSPHSNAEIIKSLR